MRISHGVLMSDISETLTVLADERAEVVFFHALQMPAGERGVFLEAACSGNARLRAEVDALLADHSHAGGFMNGAAPAARSLETEFAGPAEQSGTWIGPYRLMEKIGEGGFGAVWVAEQEKPVRRRVALKIIKPGMDSKQVIARFEQERQALAMMDHPNIAKVLDAGATPMGRPYFVMELVRGIKITAYCDQANLPTAGRLQLFIAVCHAVQHAHQKGIIHRDLKPSNILVTLHDGVPVPKVIDFGVAKAIQQQRLTDLTLYTQFEQMIGTPAYMSPEQAEMSGLDIDTRSDIYALGVLLYELLAGRPPFDPQTLLQRGLDEIRRVVREEVPQKPSTFISTLALEQRASLAQDRHTEPAKLIGQIRGDLDWIVMKALEKDRTRRYETATDFARDIRRHLASEPVQARPPTARYRFRRMVRRNKAAFSAGAGIAAALIAGSAISLWQATRARDEADRARSESKRANAALADLRASAPAFAAMARGFASQEKFDEAIARLDTAINLRPDAQEYLLSKANLLQSQFRFSEASAVYREAARLIPPDERAASNALLSEKLAKEWAAKSSLSRESLLEFFDTMSKEQRPAAEMLRAGRLLGEENKVLLTSWRERLKDLPMPADKPLAEALVVGANGRLELDLSGTSIADLSPLQGMPLHSLSLIGCTLVEDLSPLKGMPLERLFLSESPLLGERYMTAESVRDLTPLRGLPLKELTLSRTKVSSLEPLRGMPLELLAFSGTPVTDLEPLRGMQLRTLSFGDTNVSNLEPLRGMPLSRLECSSTEVVDFSALVGTPLESLNMAGSKVRDITFLRQLPLKSLAMNGCPYVKGLHVLAEIKSLEFLRVPSALAEFAVEEIEAVAALQSHQNLKSIHFGSGTTGAVRSNTVFWEEIESILRVRRPLRDIAESSGVKPGIQRAPDGTWMISLQRIPITDISPLKGLPISFLNLVDTGVTDLSPLKGMPLKELILDCDRPDLNLLMKFKLVRLWLIDCSAGLDLTPLGEIPTLENLLLPPEPKNIDALRKLPRLKRISYRWDQKSRDVAQSAEEFWGDGAGGRTPASLARAGMYAEAAKLLREEIVASNDGGAWMGLIGVVLARGSQDYYRALSVEVMANESNRYGWMAALVCLLSPWSGFTAADAGPLLGRSKPGDWKRVLEALRAYRAGFSADAARLATLPQNEMELAKAAMLKPILAMACHAAGKPEDAATALADARQLISKHWPDSGGKGFWQDWLMAHLLLQEAEKLIDGKEASGAAE
jgi:serine/threonine protein kinase